jgi:hypothetical protein
MHPFDNRIDLGDEFAPLRHQEGGDVIKQSERTGAFRERRKQVCDQREFAKARRRRRSTLPLREGRSGRSA